ncbi:MAG: hypothetical protein LBE36_01420 [Flavobacteriaceae bacterium]|jgi:hypothetical protein|nr:hypothetical protein [Flavobacteriaceae bacterium]
MDNIKIIKIVLLFFLGVALIYMPFLFLWMRRKNRKGEEFAKKYNAVKCYFKHTALFRNDILEVLEINDKKPVLFNDFKQYGWYFPLGENTIIVRYQWFKWNFLRAIAPQTNPMKAIAEREKTLKIIAEPNKTYQLYFDHKLNDYVFEEKQ